MKWLVTIALILASTLAQAGGSNLSIPDNPKWKDECGSCHVPYPPQLLTADNWQHVMGELDRHFGVNATLDANTAKEILDFLQDHSGLAWNGMKSDSGLRITDNPWFMRKHRRVSNKLWFSPGVKSPANCTACHVNAERGDWTESGIRIPRPGSKVPDAEGFQNTASTLDNGNDR